MPFQSSRVPVPSKGNSHKFSVKRFSDCCSYWSFTNTWGTDEAEDFALDRFLELADSYELEDAILDVFHSVMAIIEDFLGAINVIVFVRGDSVRELSENIEVCSGDAWLGMTDVKHHVLVDFLLNDFQNMVRYDFPFEVLFEFFYLSLSFIAFLSKMLF